MKLQFLLGDGLVFRHLLELVLLGVEDRRRVPDWILRLANDRVAWDKYPWAGEEVLIRNPYSIFGFTGHPKGCLPIERLTPDDNEARSEWAVEEQKRVVEEMMKKDVERQETYDQVSKFLEAMKVDQMRQTSKGPIIVDQHCGISNFSEFASMQMSSRSATPYWQPPMHSGNPNLQTPISSHPDDAGFLNPNILNREMRKHRPSIYKRTPYMDLPPTTVLPKKRGDRTKNKVKNANLSPLNLGNAFANDNVGDDDVMFLGGQFTGNYLAYDNVDPSKVMRGHSESEDHKKEETQNDYTFDQMVEWAEHEHFEDEETKEVQRRIGNHRNPRKIIVSKLQRELEAEATLANQLLCNLTRYKQQMRTRGIQMRMLQSMPTMSLNSYELHFLPKKRGDRTKNKVKKCKSITFELENAITNDNVWRSMTFMFFGWTIHCNYLAYDQTWKPSRLCEDILNIHVLPMDFEDMVSYLKWKILRRFTTLYYTLPPNNMLSGMKAIKNDYYTNVMYDIAKVAGKLQIFVSHSRIDLSTVLIPNDGSLEEAFVGVISEETKIKQQESLSSESEDHKKEQTQNDYTFDQMVEWAEQEHFEDEETKEVQRRLGNHRNRMLLKKTAHTIYPISTRLSSTIEYCLSHTHCFFSLIKSMAYSTNEARKTIVCKLQRELEAEATLANPLLCNLTRYEQQMRTRGIQMTMLQSMPTMSLNSYGLHALLITHEADIRTTNNLIRTRQELLRSIAAKQNFINSYMAI
ncbi:hypothetical protein Tco_1343769 [Tanacetum coccineum]